MPPDSVPSGFSSPVPHPTQINLDTPLNSTNPQSALSPKRGPAGTRGLYPGPYARWNSSKQPIDNPRPRPMIPNRPATRTEPMPTNLRHNPDARLIAMATANLTQAARIHRDAGRPEQAQRCTDLATQVQALNQPPAPRTAAALPRAATAPKAVPQPQASAAKPDNRTPHTPPPPPKTAPPPRPAAGRVTPAPGTPNPLGLTGEPATEADVQS